MNAHHTPLLSSLSALTQKTFVVIPTPLLDPLINLSGSASDNNNNAKMSAARVSERSGKTARAAAAQDTQKKFGLEITRRNFTSAAFSCFSCAAMRVAQYFHGKTIGN